MANNLMDPTQRVGFHSEVANALPTLVFNSCAWCTYLLVQGK